MGYDVHVADLAGTPPVDVTDEDAVQVFLEDVVERAGGLDLVVNSAGSSTLGLVTELAVEEFRRVVDVCLTGAFIVLKHAGRLVRDGGSVVSIASLNARQPGTGMAAYCSAKAGLAMLTEVAALELAGRGVRVNAVSPGLVPTPLTAPGARHPRRRGRLPREHAARTGRYAGGGRRRGPVPARATAGSPVRCSTSTAART